MKERIPKNWRDYIKYTQSIARASSGRKVNIEYPAYINEMLKMKNVSKAEEAGKAADDDDQD